MCRKRHFIAYCGREVGVSGERICGLFWNLGTRGVHVKIQIGRLEEVKKILEESGEVVVNLSPMADEENYDPFRFLFNHVYGSVIAYPKPEER